MGDTAIAEATHTARVLVFGVDDGAFCIHLDWVEAVYPRAEVASHAARDAAGAARAFVLHRGQPALIVDLREAFDLSEILGATERTALLVVRAGSVLLALQVDACLGVRDLDLRTKVPVPSNLLRDGGLCVGHLVEFDGKLHGLLEPSRILSSRLREQLEPFVKEAAAFADRQEKLSKLVEQQRQQPTPAGLKTFGRLSRRNGRTRTANATRVILKALQDSEQVSAESSIAGSLEADVLLRDIAALATGRRTGELQVELPSETLAKVWFEGGRIVDASLAGDWGRVALKRIIGAREGFYRFAPGDIAVQRPRVDDASLWVLIEIVEQLSEERRGRHTR